MISQNHIAKFKPEVNSEYWLETITGFDNVFIREVPLVTCVRYPTISRQFSADFFFDFVPYYDENEDWLFWCMELATIAHGVEVNYPFIHPPQQIFPGGKPVSVSRIVCYHKCLPICFVTSYHKIHPLPSTNDCGKLLPTINDN